MVQFVRLRRRQAAERLCRKWLASHSRAMQGSCFGEAGGCPSFGVLLLDAALHGVCREGAG